MTKDSSASTAATALACGDVAGLELREDVERRGLGAQPQVARDHHRRAELAERMGEGQERAREEAAAQRRQDDAAGTSASGSRRSCRRPPRRSSRARRAPA